MATTRSRAKRPSQPARRKPAAATRARARRSSATWRPRLPVLERHHVDLVGLGLIALGVFLSFPLYMAWDGGRAGDALVDGLALAIGALRYPAPVAVAAAGLVVVLRPVLPTVRPFRAGALCLLAALALALAAGTLGLGPEGARHGFWNEPFLRDRGGYLGDALLYASSNLLGAIGAHILAGFLFLGGMLLLAGAPGARVLQGTGTG